MTILQAIILAIVEGLTEFLPVSSTGHMIITSAMLGIESDEFTKLFEVCIQFGTILSVVVLYYKRFFKSFDFYFKLVAGFLPAGILGFILDDYIDTLLGSPMVVAVNLLFGGIFFLFVDKIFNPKGSGKIEPDYIGAAKIGLFQSLAMIPGVSRSAASIIGGQFIGLSREKAAEFSFFLAVPTMFAATCYKLLKNYEVLKPEHTTLLVVGNVVGFAVAMLAIKLFIGILQKYGFKFFGYYRIVVGLIIIVLLLNGYDLKLD
jgi:undecaprenyl-diphosphatase